MHVLRVYENSMPNDILTNIHTPKILFPVATMIVYYIGSEQTATPPAPATLKAAMYIIPLLGPLNRSGYFLVKPEIVPF